MTESQNEGVIFDRSVPLTVGKLIELLKLHPMDNPMCFGPNETLTFFRVKDRSGITQIEFNERFIIDE